MTETWGYYAEHARVCQQMHDQSMRGRDKNLVRAWLAGGTVSGISAEVGLSRARVHQIIRTRLGRPLTNALRDEINGNVQSA